MLYAGEDVRDIDMTPMNRMDGNEYLIGYNRIGWK